MNRKFLLLLYGFITLVAYAQPPGLSWSKQIAGQPSFWAQGESVVHGPNGNVYTSGFFTGTFDFDPGPGTYTRTAVGRDFFLCALDSSGSFLWVKVVTVTGSSQAQVKLDYQGNFLLCGYFNGVADFDPSPATYTVSSNMANFVLKLDSQGNFLWVKTYDGSLGFTISSGTSGEVILVGAFQSTIDFDPGPSTFTMSNNANSTDIFISKLDNAGNFIWAKRIGSGQYDSGIDGEIDASGNIIALGCFTGQVDFDPGPNSVLLNSNAVFEQLFILKLDPAGNFIWVKSTGSFNNSSSTLEARDITLDPAGNLLIGGNYEGQIDFDPSPATYTLAAAGLTDVFILKLDAQANFLWVRTINGTSMDRLLNVTTNSLGAVYALGTFSSSIDFDPGLSTLSLTAVNMDLFISKYSSAGSFDWAFNVGGSSADMNGNLNADDAGRLYLCGGFGSTFNFEIPPSTYTLSPQSSADVFIARYAPKAETPPVEPLAIRTENTELKAKIFPNPLKTVINIKLPEGTGATSLSLYSASGVLISTWSFLEATEIDLSEQSSGLYFVTMEFENRASETLKLLKE